MTRILVDHRDAPVERTHWRTLAVFAHTFSGSSKVVGRAALGRLTPEDVDRVVARWCDHIFRISRTTLVVDGQEHVERGRPYVVLSNHQSLLDVPSALVAFPGRLRFVAKQELRSVPMFGAALAAVGIVFVDRADRSRAIEQLRNARAHLEAGMSVWVAAEGTRSKDGQLGALKKGGFHVALALGVPILPTWIEGTLGVIPPGQLASVTGQTVTVRFGPPIPTAGLGRDDLEALVAQTREALQRLQRPKGV